MLTMLRLLEASVRLLNGVLILADEKIHTVFFLYV